MRELLFSRRWLPRHLLVLLMVVVFLALGWWQLKRGEQGNLRSFAYALEWPFFAAFAIFGWLKLLRLEVNPPEERRIGPDSAGAVNTPATDGKPLAAPVQRRADAPASGTGSAGAPDEADDELARYNRYLAWLNEQDRQQAR